MGIDKCFYESCHWSAIPGLADDRCVHARSHSHQGSQKVPDAAAHLRERYWAYTHARTNEDYLPTYPLQPLILPRSTDRQRLSHCFWNPSSIHHGILLNACPAPPRNTDLFSSIDSRVVQSWGHAIQFCLALTLFPQCSVDLARWTIYICLWAIPPHRPGPGTLMPGARAWTHPSLSWILRWFPKIQLQWTASGRPTMTSVSIGPTV